MSSLSGSDIKPHVICVPFPAQGHINPMLKLAKILHYRGFHITFVNTEFNHSRLLRSQGLNALNGLPTFRFETIPDGLPPSTEFDSTQDVPSLCYSIERNCTGPFLDLIARLNNNNDATEPEVPPVSCIVSDGAMYFTLEVAEELGIPEVLLWTASACGLLGYAQYERLIEEGFTPFQDASNLKNGYLDTPIDWIPAMKGICLKDMPSFIRTTDRDDIMLNFFVSMIKRFHSTARAILINSFDPLEHQVIKSLSTSFPPLHPIGPLNFMLDQIEQYSTYDETAESLASNLWKADPMCLEWLDSKDPRSIIYVNFGCITVMTNDQLVEFAMGLANSDKHFLWIIRPDAVTGDTDTLLPPEFAMETKDRGLIAGWCDQEKVLSHPAVGGFLTHSGWNSTLESICNGVPMISWPFFAEQQTNCWYCCNELAIGMEINSDVKRDEVEKQVRELMDGEKGKEMRRRTMEWRELAKEATDISAKGSSYLNLDHVITNLQLNANKNRLETQ